MVEISIEKDSDLGVILGMRFVWRDFYLWYVLWGGKKKYFCFIKI